MLWICLRVYFFLFWNNLLCHLIFDLLVRCLLKKTVLLLVAFFFFFFINEGYIKIHFTKNYLDIYFIIIYYIYSSFMSDMFDRFRTKNSFTVLIVQSFFIYLLSFWQMTTFWHKTLHTAFWLTVTALALADYLPVGSNSLWSGFLTLHAL